MSRGKDFARVLARCFCAETTANNSRQGPQGLFYATHGPPASVLALRDIPIPSTEKIPRSAVLLRFLASPVNPADLMTVEGTYPLLPTSLPAVGGGEGVAEVVAVGRSVRGFSNGDWAVIASPRDSGGSWREGGLAPASSLFNVPHTLPLSVAATLGVGAQTAVRLLRCAPSLRPGDGVAINGASSVVGRYLVSVASSYGFRPVALLRPRERWDEDAEELKALGAEVVLRDEPPLPPPSPRAPRFTLSQGLSVRLALNCVGGDSAATLVSLLSPSGLLITYGGMSKSPLRFSTSSFLFKGITASGFWLSGWEHAQGIDAKEAAKAARGETKARESALSECVRLSESGVLRPPHVAETRLEDWREAFAAHAAGAQRRKTLFVF